MDLALTREGMSRMTAVRILVGTQKGAFILTADGTRSSWNVAGPLFGGCEVYHVTGSPSDPARLYASQSTGWFGQLIQRSDDGGATWRPVGNEFSYMTAPGTHQWYDGTPHPWEFARVWHLEPSWDDPDILYAGVEDAALFESRDGGVGWTELSGLRTHRSSPNWQPGAGGMCVHTILVDPTDNARLHVAISAAGVFRSDDAGRTWVPGNHGLRSEGLPDPEADVGHCVHRIARHRDRPNVLYMQKHWDVMRSDDNGATSRATLDFRSQCTRMIPRRSTSCLSLVTRSITRREVSSASTEAGPEETTGNRSVRVSPRPIATSMCYEMPWPSTCSTTVACISARLAGRCTRPAMQEIRGFLS